MNVFITGINGFICSALAEALCRRGHQVTGSVRNREKRLSAPQCAAQPFVIRLNEEVGQQIFRGVDVLIHGAYDFRKGKANTNLAGTERLAQAALEAGVKEQIFIGSYSAHEAAISEYGQTKWKLEKFFTARKQMVVKPGLVVGRGGLFFKTCSIFQRYPVVPLIDGGKGKLPVISIRDLTGAMIQLVENPKAGSYRLYNAEQVSLKELFVEIKRAGKFKTLLVPVPFQPLYLSLRTLEAVVPNFPVNTENLKGFQANQAVYEPTDLYRFIPHPMTLADMIDAVFSTC